jgi:hypothetical protein
VKLTQHRIEGLICPAGKKDKLVFDDEQKGLAVRVTASGGRTYLAQYSHAGKKRRVPLGTVDAISLAQARIAAQAIMGDVAKGRDPATERKALAAKRKKAHDALTVGKLVLGGAPPRQQTPALRHRGDPRNPFRIQGISRLASGRPHPRPDRGHARSADKRWLADHGVPRRRLPRLRL